MNLVTMEIEVHRGLNRLNIRRDSNLLCVELTPGPAPHMAAYFACPTGRMGDEQVKLVIEDTGTMVSYDADVEYINSFRHGNRMYHAFILRERANDHVQG